jgi:hypothetical protein
MPNKHRALGKCEHLPLESVFDGQRLDILQRNRLSELIEHLKFQIPAIRI